jgi:hypothetical protein
MEKKVSIHFVILGNCMKRDFLCFASVCILLWPVSDRTLAGTPPRSSFMPGTDSAAVHDVSATDNAVGGNEYYVDCGVAERNGEGRSPASAWHTLDAVNAHQFLPGDVIYLKRGTECHGFLWPKGSGSASAVIRLSAYGQGARPRVLAGKGDEEAFKLFDQEYWDVDSIEFSGGSVFGVFVSGHAGILHHIHIRNLLVHDVHGGEVKSKESGLVVISPGKVQQHFDDVLVEGVTAYRTEQWAGILVGGGNFGEVAEENWNTHVIVRNSSVHDVYGDGIILFRVKDGLIDTSAAWHTGMQPTQSIGTPNAIWTWMCKDCVVSKNEAFLTDSPGVDGGAFDIDYGNTRNSVLDNYGHDTQGYCVAVFGAAYVTHDSVVEGNLCVNNGKSPRMARYQGAMFLWTWNNGAIENLRVERNTVYWNPPGNFPAVLNRADIRGRQKIFRGNQIYSSSPWILESNKEMLFQDNRYTTCGGNAASWVFDNHTYGTFEEFRAGAGQEQGSTWKPDMAMVRCLGNERSRAQGSADDVRDDKDIVSTPRKTQTGWTIVSEIPVNIDTEGLLDTVSAGQLLVLKNLFMQFRASGLRMIVTLDLKHPSPREAVQNVIGDLAMSDIKTSESTDRDFSTQPRTRLIAPDGSLVREWQDFVGPADIGLAVRSSLGEPLFSQMESDVH